MYYYLFKMKLTYPSILTVMVLPTLIHAFALFPTRPVPSSWTHKLNSTAIYITSMPLHSSPAWNASTNASSNTSGSVISISPTGKLPSNITAYCTQQCNKALASCKAVCHTPECPDVPCNPEHCQDDCEDWFGRISPCVKKCAQDPGVPITYPYPNATRHKSN